DPEFLRRDPVACRCLDPVSCKLYHLLIIVGRQSAAPALPRSVGLQKRHAGATTSMLCAAPRRRNQPRALAPSEGSEGDATATATARAPLPASAPGPPAPLRSCGAARAAPAGARAAIPTAAPRTVRPAP